MSKSDSCESQESGKKAALGSSSEIAISGGVQILSLLSAIVTGGASVAFSAFSAGGTVLLSAWQMEQQKKFVDQFAQKLSSLDQTKLDKEVLESPEFKELILRILNEAMSTASVLKQRALANGLINFALYPHSRLTGKLILIRTIAQMSDEELCVLEIMQNAWESSIPFLEENSFQELLPDLDLKQIQEACEGLIQQRVLECVNSKFWGLSIIGRRLVAWLSGKEEQEDFENRQKMHISELKEELSWNTHKIVSDRFMEHARMQLRNAGL